MKEGLDKRERKTTEIKKYEGRKQEKEKEKNNTK